MIWVVETVHPARSDALIFSEYLHMICFYSMMSSADMIRMVYSLPYSYLYQYFYSYIYVIQVFGHVSKGGPVIRYFSYASLTEACN